MDISHSVICRVRWFTMKPKMKIKIGIDFLMTVLLLLLMAYQVVGETLHEWFGAAMLVLFIAHNILNIKWYKNLFHGKYKPVRILGTTLNLVVLAALLSLGYSGIVMSRHLFAFLPINRGMALARVMHLAGSYWGFVLISLHLGLHWGMIIGMFRKLTGGKKLLALVWILRLFAAAIAGYGAFCFIRADLFSYMFLQNAFAFFDIEKNAIAVFSEYITMMGLWVCIGYYAVKGLGILSNRKEISHEKN